MTTMALFTIEHFTPFFCGWSVASFAAAGASTPQRVISSVSTVSDIVVLDM